MSLIKREDICSSCNKQYIVVMKPEDLIDLSCCPFCSFPIEHDPTELGSDEDE